jgi:FkbM family methyltransferase
MRTLKKDVKVCLDIGAYHGDFTRTLKIVWPDAVVYQIEADSRNATFLPDSAIFALLGDEDGKVCNFYTLDETKITTGSSIYKEMTPFYTPETTVTVQKTMISLDALSRNFDFSGPWATAGLIKIDTQGSELLILDGAREFLREHKPRFILLECSVMPYNEGGPLIQEVFSYMDDLSYQVTTQFDASYDYEGRLVQMDILFERKD